PEHLVAYKDCAPHAVDAFLEWQGALPEDRPYLAYVNLLEAHHPRVPSAASRAAVAPSEVVERSLATDASLLRLMSAMEGHDTLDDEEREAVVATYDATLRDLDDATGRLLDGLRDRGVLDRTVVIVVSDHGENLGERGMWDHRWDLHQPLVHVPLIVRYPPSVVAGRHLDAVSTANLFGTVLALTGLPAPVGAGSLPPFGADDQVFTELVVPTPRLPEVRRAWPDLIPRRWDRRYREVIEGPYALLQSDDGFTGLVDLVADPGETTLLDDPARTARMVGLLERFEATRPKIDASLRTSEDRPGDPLALRPGEAGLLEALGYVEPSP
ncbi:MAG: sulfatase-like hydrolase/transferase, partial [Myxococcales bacterium]|nr:sulfatase-like hydrolase/transferase [Myxococcales bacterium]